VTLPELRQEIDRIDDQLRDLFARRMALAGQIAAVKRREQLPLPDSAREQEILLRLTANQDAVLAGYTERLFNAIFAMSKTYQEETALRNQRPTEN
jgi:chorismate mutase/prephenate dehydratase